MKSLNIQPFSCEKTKLFGNTCKIDKLYKLKLNYISEGFFKACFMFFFVTYYFLHYKIIHFSGFLHFCDAFFLQNFVLKFPLSQFKISLTIHCFKKFKNKHLTQIKRVFLFIFVCYRFTTLE